MLRLAHRRALPPVDRLLGLGLLAGSGLLWACGGDSGPSDQYRVTQDEAELLGGLAYGELFERLAAMREFKITTVFSLPEPACNPDKSDPADTDSDGDGVPDDQLLTYTAANCTVEDAGGVAGVTSVITGTMRVQDTDGGDVIFGYLVTYSDLLTTVQYPDGNISSHSVDGHYEVATKANGATGEENLTYTSTRHDDPVAPDFNLQQRMVLSFSFAPTAAAIDPGTGLFPSGSYVIEGSFNAGGEYAGLNGSYDFTVSTEGPLDFNPACGALFNTGLLRFGLVASQGQTGFTIAPQESCSVFIDITAFDNQS